MHIENTEYTPKGDAPTHIELIGGPNCGSKVKASIEEIGLGSTIFLPCNQYSDQTGNHKWDHLDASYIVQADSTAVFIGYNKTVFEEGE